MKKIFLAITSLLLVFPANALPGQKTEQVTSWIKQHKFLSPWYEGNLTHYPEGIFITGFRRLQDNWFIDVGIKLENTKEFLKTEGRNEKKLIQDAIVTEETLYLLQKKYAAVDKEEYPNVRPWKNVDCKDVWNKDNETAKLLLQNIYSKAVSDDFANAKMIYKGKHATTKHWGYGVYTDYPSVQTMEEAEEYGMTEFNDTEIHLGKLYSYRRLTHENYFYDRESNPNDKRGCVYLAIESPEKGVWRASTLSNNQKLFSQWKALEAKKNERIKPADISID